jgi:hypothetical protein
MFKPIHPFFWFTISFKAKLPTRVELSYNKLVMSILQGQIPTHDSIDKTAFVYVAITSFKV